VEGKRGVEMVINTSVSFSVPIYVLSCKRRGKIKKRKGKEMQKMG